MKPNQLVPLGDGVSARREDDRIMLYLESLNGVVTDAIALEPETYQALVAFAAKPFKLSRRGQKVRDAMKRAETKCVENFFEPKE